MEYNKKRNICLAIKKGAAIATVGLGLSSSMAGINMRNVDYEKAIVIDDTEEDKVNIPWQYKDSIYGYLLDKNGECYINKETADTIKSLTINYMNDDLLWLNQFENLEKLYLVINSSQDFYGIETLPDFDHLERLVIINFDIVPISFDDRFSSLLEIKKIDELSLVNLQFGSSIVYDLKNTTQLSVGVNADTNLDYKKLTNFQTINFTVDKPYNLAIGFTKKDYEYLINNGVFVKAKEENILNDALNIDDDLNKIVENINISYNASDQDKLDSILVYVLENLQYDKDIALYASLNVQHQELISNFYDGGMLYASLNEDTSICGNYAALFTALANRVGLKSKLLLSENHAWNMVTVDGNDYYVDATWLDTEENIDKIKEGNTDDLKWYLADPNRLDSVDAMSSHLPYNLVVNVSKPIVNSDMELSNEISEDEYTINVNGKNYNVSIHIVLGLLCAFGGALYIRKLHKNNPKENDVEEQVSSIHK